MIKTRVIPLLLLQDGLLKKPVRFRNPRTVANPISIVRVFEARQVDELVLLDIGCGPQHKNVNPDIVRMIAEELTVPFACGGGVTSAEDAGHLISAGAEKVVINSAAVEHPELITEISDRYGRQCLVVSIDAMRGDDGTYEVYTRNGSHPSGLIPVEWATEAERRGAGEILINSIQHDGAMEGYDIALIRMIADAVNIPVIAAGGAGEVGHFAPAILEGHAAAVAAGSIYHYTRITPDMVKAALSSARSPVRPVS
jgi:cyclase